MESSSDYEEVVGLLEKCLELELELEEEDNRCVDDLVKFITGDTETKKRRKKRKHKVQSASRTEYSGGSCSKNSKIANAGIKHNNDGIKAETKDDSDPNDALHTKLKNTKEGLEGKIAEKRMHFDAQAKNIKDVIDVRSAEVQNLVFMIEKSQDEKIKKLSEVDKFDKELSELEKKMAELKLEKARYLEEIKKDDERIKECEYIKSKVEDNFENELKMAKEKEKNIKKEILDLESKLQETNMRIESLPKTNQPFYDPNEEFLKFIDKQINEKEKELECPVCLDIACSPIFMCSEQHLICSTCRPKLSNCPECRVVYTGKNRKHRYAEKTAEELIKLKNKKDQVGKTRVSTILVKF